MVLFSTSGRLSSRRQIVMECIMKKVFIIFLLFFVVACELEAPKCNVGKQGLGFILYEWMQERVTNATIKVLGVKDFYEIKSIPTVLGTTIYDDFKGSRLCKATAVIEISDTSGNKIDEKIDVRYQNTITLMEEDGRYFSNTRMSGYDVEEMTKSLQKAVRKLKGENNYWY